MKIKIKCSAPKYAKGEYTFSSLEELLKWLLTIRALPKGLPGGIVFKLAKDGKMGGIATARYGFEGAECDFHDYFLARKLARETGLLRSRGLSEVISRDPEAALAFARAFDREARKREAKRR